ncbi:hypothetical protein HS041_07720 [Planomonospora sp. ID67723]|uniref:hypothetical protein n=1 Tax=Planomonospora sp. ID67723 TaxID=2738134 RepID=UPI0018C3780D|nr:hypothetical protein [Planomonospora sp. ID67723]MBG0827649.1 hypothetical protein [Planomonospora sp. ID67723]
MRIRSILSAVTLVGGLALLHQPAHAITAGARQDATVITDIVEYQCTATGAAEKQDVRVKIEMKMPIDAEAGRQMSIGWRGTYLDDATALRAPATGLADGTKLYTYASISELPGLTSATGVSDLATLGPGQIVPLPAAAVLLKTTPSRAGTATVRPAALNLGTRPTEPTIQCEVRNADALTTYPLTIVSADGLPTDPSPVTPPPTATTTASARPTQTVTATVTAQPVRPTAATETEAPPQPGGKVMKTPLGGAATGGGGEAGPDGRVLVSAGFLLTLTAATGLLLCRRRVVLRR